MNCNAVCLILVVILGSLLVSTGGAVTSTTGAPEILKLDSAGTITTHVVGDSVGQPLFPVPELPDIFVGVNYDLSKRYWVSSIFARLRVSPKGNHGGQPLRVVPSSMEVSRVQGPFNQKDSSSVSAKCYWMKEGDHWLSVCRRDSGKLSTEISTMLHRRLRCELGVSNNKRYALPPQPNNNNGWSLPDLRVDAFGQMQATQKANWNKYAFLVKLRRRLDWNLPEPESTLFQLQVCHNQATTLSLHSVLEQPRSSTYLKIRHDITVPR